MWNSQAMRHSPIHHTDTQIHTTCTHCNVNKQQEQKKEKTMLKFMLFCKLFVPIRIPFTANMMVHECVKSAITVHWQIHRFEFL